MQKKKQDKGKENYHRKEGLFKRYGGPNRDNYRQQKDEEKTTRYNRNEEISCYKCKRKGHIARECKKKNGIGKGTSYEDKECDYNDEIKSRIYKKESLTDVTKKTFGVEKTKVKHKENIIGKKISSSKIVKGLKAVNNIFNNDKIKIESIYALIDIGAEISLVDHKVALKHEWILFDAINSCRGVAKAKINVIGGTFVMIAPEEDVEATSLTLSVVKDLGRANDIRTRLFVYT